jgi:hypothetical protein
MKHVLRYKDWLQKYKMMTLPFCISRGHMGGSEGMVNLDAEWSGLVHVPVTLPQPPPLGRSTVIQLNTRLRRHSQSGSFGEDSNLLPLPGIEPWFLCCQTPNSITIMNL